jgi:outer membrane biosynthesis protein TonB
MRALLAFPIAALAALSGSACASAAAKAPADRPALNVPAPPPRVLEPPAELEPEPVSELPTPPTTTPAATRPNRQRESKNNNAAEAKPETKPETKPAEVTAPPPEPAAPPAAPPAQLRTPQTADPSGAAKNVQATIDRARSSLNSINYATQSDERKKAYNDVKRFIVQAEDAMKQGNFVFGQAVAAKAETLARELAGK